MALKGVLVQNDQRVQVVAVAVYLLLTQADAQPDVPASDDGLIAVVSIHLQPQPRSRARQRVAGFVQPITGCPTDPDDYVFC